MLAILSEVLLIQKNPRAHKNRIGTSPAPPPKPKIPPPPYMREIATMWQIGVLAGKLCTFLAQKGSFSAFWHYKNKERLSRGTPPPLKTRNFMDMGFLLQKERIFSGAHKIGAASSGPQNCGQKCLRTRGFF